MTTAQFFEKFDLFAGAPDAVAKMRSLILELAVRGQLTSFHPSAPSDPSVNPFPIPQDWQWASLREVAAPCGQKKPDALFTYIDVGAIDNQRGVISAKAEVVEAAKAPSRARKVVRSGCVIYATVRPYLRNIAIVTRDFDPPAIASTAFAVLMPEKALDAQFLFYWLRCASFQEIVSSKMKGVAYPAISDTEFWQCPIPLPPLAEQKRIVAKVDELMALCDQLEAQQQERETKHTALAQATLARFAEAPTPTNLNLLFHSFFSIQPSDLRKTILTLAIQGKLVPRDSNDEPARLVKSQSVEPTFSSEILINMPTSWRWVPIGSVAESRLGKMLDKQKNKGTEHPYLRNTNVHWFRFELESIKTMRFEDAELDEYRLQPGDVLICEGGHGIARTAVWKGQIPSIMFQKALHRVRPSSNLNGDYFAYCLRVYEQVGILQRFYTGAGIPHFTGKALAKITIPLPPLAEQKRIVAKVEELMALVDALEAQQAAADQAAPHLLDAVVSELAAAA